MIVDASFNYHWLSLTIMFAIKRSRIVHDSLSKSHNVVLAQLVPSLLLRAIVNKYRWALNFVTKMAVYQPRRAAYYHNFSHCNAGWHLWRVAGPPQTRKDERMNTEERRERDVSIRLHIKLPLHFSLPGFLNVFAFVTFSLSASLSSKYSSKLLLLVLHRTMAMR